MRTFVVRPLAVRLGAALLSAALVASTAAASVPTQRFTVDDLLRLESFDGVLLSPDRRRVAIAYRAPYLTAPTFANGQATALALGRVRLVDLMDPRRAYDLGGRTVGISPGPFSPDGRRLVLYRYAGGRLNLGVLRLSDRLTRWWPITPERRGYGRSVQWVSNTRLLALGAAPGRPAADLLEGQAAASRLAALQRRAALGLDSFTVVGAGRFATRRAPVDRLVELNALSGAQRTHARGAFEDFEASPDGQVVALLVRDGEARLNAVAVAPSEEGVRRTLRLLDLRTRRLTPSSAPLDLLPGLLSWSAAPHRLLAYGRAPSGGEWEGGAFVIVGEDGLVERTSSAPGPACVDRDPNSRLAIVHGGWTGSALLLKLCPDPKAPAGWWRLDAGGGFARITAIATSATLQPTVDGVLFRDGGRTWRIPPTGPPERRPDEGAGLERTLATAGFRGDQNPPSPAEAGAPLPLAPASTPLAAETLACASWGCLAWKTDAHGVGRLELRRERGPARPMLRLNADLSSVAFATPIPLRRSTGASEVVDWLYLPPFLKGGERPPLLVAPYPGATYETSPFLGAPGAFALVTNPQVMAGLGYAVLIPSLPRPLPLHGAEGVAQEIQAAIAATIRDGRVDPTRVALWGQSFGGYGALIAAEAGGPIRAVVAQAAPEDLLAMHGGLDPVSRAFPEDARSLPFVTGWAETGQGGLGGPPWKTPDTYLDASPVRFADKITVPLLLVHGDQDFINITQPEEMFTALRRQDRDVEFATAWGEGHVVESPGNVRALYRLVDGFLRRTLTLPRPTSAPRLRSPEDPSPPRSRRTP